LEGTPIFNNNNDSDAFTLCFANLHGLKTRHTPLQTSLCNLIATLELYNISSVCGVSEHHLALRSPKVSQTIHTVLQRIRQQSPSMCNFHSSAEVSSGTDCLMGGTGIIAMGDTIGHIEHNGKGGNPMGRWSFVHLKQHSQPPLTFILVYPVCTTPSNTIGTTAWHQQRHALDAFVEDLQLFITALQAKNHAIIVGGDWNDYMESPNSSVLQVCTHLNLVDPWIAHYPQNATFPTHKPGTNRIDSVLVSHDILSSVESIGYTSGP
jgi:hypothetical protein